MPYGGPGSSKAWGESEQGKQGNKRIACVSRGQTNFTGFPTVYLFECKSLFKFFLLAT